MITKQEYQTAKSIVEEYEDQLRDQLERDAIDNVGGCSACGDLDSYSCVCNEDDPICEDCQDKRALCFCGELFRKLTKYHYYPEEMKKPIIIEIENIKPTK